MSLSDKDRYHLDLYKAAYEAATNSRLSDDKCRVAGIRAVLEAPPYVDPVEAVACELSEWTLETLRQCDNENKALWLRVAKRAIELGAKAGVKP